VTPEQVEEIILTAIDEVNEMRMEDDGPEYEALPADLSVVISGTDAELDSLDLITLVTSVEEALKEDGVDLDLSNFLVLSNDETAETLRDFVLESLA
jgi:acyl carrier protein